jgi:ribosomal protein S12 methylthiotransferase accessory factor
MLDSSFGSNIFNRLVSPFGVIGEVRSARSSWSRGNIEFHVANAGTALPGHGVSVRNILDQEQIARGCGISLYGADHARLVAVAEAAERYAGRELSSGESILASASELAGATIDASRIPRCSAHERSRGCPLRHFDPESRIRWVRGVDWMTGEDVWVPAIMACYAIKKLRDAERFWNRLSTGYAVHSDPAEALLRSLWEVIERDAIAVVWQQMLSLPWVPPQYFPDSVRYLCESSRRQFIDTFIFDATTDIGVPTAYCVQVARHDERARQVLGCATRRNFADAAEHAVLETLQVRDTVFSDCPESVREFGSIGDGARYMARPERTAAFDFLLKGAEDRAARPSDGIPQSTGEALDWIKSRLGSMQAQVIIVDRTPDELADLGLTALCAIIPSLQPMSLVPQAQYRAHPRLYEAPRLMGYRSLPEEKLNPWPQPLS